MILLASVSSGILAIWPNRERRRAWTIADRLLGAREKLVFYSIPHCTLYNDVLYKLNDWLTYHELGHLDNSLLIHSENVHVSRRYLHSLIDVLLIACQLIRSKKPVRIASNTVADAITLTQQSSVPQHLGTVLHCLQIFSIIEYLPDTTNNP